MSTIIVRMKHQKMNDLGKNIEEGLMCFGKAMSIYEEMKSMCEEEGMYERSYPHMRGGWEPEDYPRFPEERKGYRRY